MSSILLYGLNIIAMFLGILAGVIVRNFSKAKKVRPIRWGVTSILVLNVALLAGVIRHYSKLSSQAATDGVQHFNDSVAMGSVIGTVIFPSLIILCLTWILIRIKAGRIVQRVESADDMDASSVVSIGNKVATVIFWIFGGGFLLLALWALVLGR